MSFRTRLTLFFMVIVVGPAILTTFVMLSLINDNENGKADARIAARQDAAINLYYVARNEADRLARKLGKDRVLTSSLQTGNQDRAQRRAQQLLISRGAHRIVFAKGVRAIIDAGRRDAILPAKVPLKTTADRTFGTLQVSTTIARRFARLAQKVVGLDLIVRNDDAVLYTTLPGSENVALPERRGTVSIAGDDYRVATFRAPGFLGAAEQITLLDARAKTTSTIGKARWLVILIVVSILLLMYGNALWVARSLQSHIDEFLEAARRLGEGDFSAEIPITGRDAFAGLGEEFNKMSRQLERRLQDLREEQARLQRSMRRIGETFASNLDRDALLEIVVRTAVEGAGADGGRAAARREPDVPLEQIARDGALSGLDGALEQAEARALESDDAGGATVGEVHALAHPLRGGDADRANGVVSVGRRGRPFSESERELFHYLAGQASVSMENVGLHETVERQAATDELTGLFNRRRFQEVIEREVERTKRFGQELGLVMLDIDNFKAINDTHGHQQGDVVLREVAKVLRDSAREIDEPARYGGEELAVVLPGTDLEGAFALAERVRQGIESLELPLLGNGGQQLRVTASFGVAALPGSAVDLRGLIAAADEALYEAKRTGKNKTVRAAGG
jgi:diguanylate cyclase (GGDEF)-like protein